MEYRRFGSSDWQVSALGFGCMRLPTIDRNPFSEKIDQHESIKMIRYGIDRGINYVDSAYVYHGGRSESVLGEALRDGYRNKVRIATKLPVGHDLVQNSDDFDRILDDQLKRLRTDYIDYYLFHALSERNWEKTLRLDLLERAENALRAGKIRHLGFSFHDTYDAFDKIVNGYDGWTLAQIQYNYMDTTNQAGTKGLQLAASKGLAVVIMEPLLGGKLANPPKAVKALFEAPEVARTPADLALQWLWDQPEVSVVLSGMTRMPQVHGNVAAAENSAHHLTTGETRLIESVIDKFRSQYPIPCTGCGYCMPCPNGIDIRGCFKCYNDAHSYEDLKGTRMLYSWRIAEGSRAESCIQCGLCEEKCPQQIPISEWMPKVHSLLG